MGFLRVLRFPLSVLFQSRSTLNCLYMRHLREGRTGEAWVPSNSNALSQVREH
jgi:hypothetical protein